MTYKDEFEDIFVKETLKVTWLISLILCAMLFFSWGRSKGELKCFKNNQVVEVHNDI
tara:strand:- start:2777 stop:2947 length:171 start_codon:yes stop_codon:yes gene_type:complete